MFAKILIANRGEIACRVMRTCRRLGIATVAVYSDADAGARHVRLANEAVRIGPPPATESYLRIDSVLDAAARTGAEAIHPGYGFLAENADFAMACANRGVVFIGPPVEAIRIMGSKSAAKALMAEAGVPLVPGYHGDDQDPARLTREAEAIGYPLLIKASAGGGGKGMRVVRDAAAFEPALAACRREAASSFGDDRVLLERYLERPRHIEVQVFGDTHGNLVHLFERDCSVQRRHQKVVEEAPAPGMSRERRTSLCAAACDAARAVGYAGAGTVEFIVSQDGAFHFMEMNTRLQVEHPVTEMITGQDLVEWQLRVAAGEKLPLAQEALSIRGHALEARIYAEDPQRDFLPSTGTLVHLRLPAETLEVRVDTGIAEGDVITPFYDPMIAKLIVWDADRDGARRRMATALAEVELAGVASNAGFLARLIDDPAFAAADLDTGIIERRREALLPPPADPPAAILALAALAELRRDADVAVQRAGRGADPHSPWNAGDGWRFAGAPTRQLAFRAGSDEIPVAMTYRRDGSFSAAIAGTTMAIGGGFQPDGSLRAEIDGAPVVARWVPAGAARYVFAGGRTYVLRLADQRTAPGARAGHGQRLTAPMPGRIVALLAAPGRVAQGAPLLVLEAMKMEHTIDVPADGELRAFRWAVGDQVPEGAELVDFVADPPA